jgi:succinate-semialdehyde dehydrogenase/glutarate-semialdehyde dehydrogenase
VAGVTLTGSERAGAAVAERAGRSLKKVVMELGGSDPFIVLDDADLEHAVAGALFGRMFGTGQSCIGSKRIIVVGRDRGEKFLAEFTAAMQNQKPGDPMDPNTELGPVSSEQALETLLAQVSEARAAGARVVTGGDRIDRDGFYVEPTVLTDIDPANPAYNTEFFRPVASFLHRGFRRRGDQARQCDAFRTEGIGVHRQPRAWARHRGADRQRHGLCEPARMDRT